MKTFPKPTFTIRLDPQLVAIAKNKGYSLSRVLEAELQKIAESENCPTCNQTKVKPIFKPKPLPPKEETIKETPIYIGEQEQPKDEELL